MRNEDRKLDWVPGQHDPRSRAFTFYGSRPESALLPIQPRFWRTGLILDQGAEGACVGYGWTAELIASPFPHTEKLQGETRTFAQNLYQLARKHDREQGWHWPEGASVLGGAKSVRAMGYMGEFRWALSVEEVRDAIINEGPVVIGVPWFSGMYNTRPSSLVQVHGKLVGGHCLTITGYHPEMRIHDEGWKARHEVFRWVNSWGTGYGDRGTGLIRFDDLKFLLSQQGEACVPMNRKPVRQLL